MEQYQHKEEIINTRVGGLGGSDATMLAQIANLGYVPKNAYKRLAVCKGLIPSVEHATTPAMRFGDYIENQIYQHLLANNGDYKSNPMIVSKKYSKKNCKLFCHPDFMYVDEANEAINIYEVKATKLDARKTRIMYSAQLYIEWLLAKEYAIQMEGRWRVNLYLVHYSTDGLNLDEPNEFTPDRMSVHKVKFNTQVLDVNFAMNMVDGFLEKFDYYSEDEEIDATLLPTGIKSQFDNVVTCLNEIKAYEQKVEEFKTRLYSFMLEKSIKKISCESFSFTLVNPTESCTVDYKKFFADEIEAKHPTKAKRFKEKYKKVTKRNGYVTVKVK